MKKTNYLMDSWNLQAELDSLPDSELKQTIIEWQTKEKQAIAPGTMSLSGIFYRNNLQYLLENIDKPEKLLKELRESIAKPSSKPPEYGQLLLKHGREFKSTFGMPLKNYMDLITGFDIVKFDEEIVKPPDGTSCQQAVKERWGEPAVKLIKSLM
jgi:hypothetical protein